MPKRPRWTRDELILALDLYREIGLGHKTHKDVLALSALLQQLPAAAEVDDPAIHRNANGVAMKLSNFAAIDPNYTGVGLSSFSRADKAVWDEFTDDRSGLRRAAARIRASLSADPT